MTWYAAVLGEHCPCPDHGPHWSVALIPLPIDVKACSALVRAVDRAHPAEAAPRRCRVTALVVLLVLSVALSAVMLTAMRRADR